MLQAEDAALQLLHLALDQLLQSGGVGTSGRDLDGSWLAPFGLVAAEERGGWDVLAVGVGNDSERGGLTANVFAVLDIDELVLLLLLASELLLLLLLLLLLSLLLLQQALAVELDFAVLLADRGAPDVLWLDGLLGQAVRDDAGPVDWVDADEVTLLWLALTR